MVWALLLAIAGFSFWAGTHTAIGRRISGVAIAIFISVAFGNIGILPRESEAYGAVFGQLLPTAIALLLLQADLVKIVRQSGPLLIAFGVAIVATIGGVFVSLLIIDLGANRAALGGMFVATYTGGSINFFAVAETAGFRASPLLAPTVAADTLATNFYLIGAMTLPGLAWAARLWPSPLLQREGRNTEVERASAPRLDPISICLGLALAALLASLGTALADAFGAPSYSIVCITALALIVANAAPKQMARFEGLETLGLILLFVFLSALGAGADVRAMTGEALPITIFAVLVLVIHLALVLGLGKLLKIGLPELLIASNAAVGGSSSAGPIAAALGWRELVTPGILVGALGNAVATFLGVGLYKLLG